MTTMNYPTGDQLKMPWATWVPDRSPQFKVHTSLRLAKSAVGSPSGNAVVRNGRYQYRVRGGVVYQVMGDRWVVRTVIEPGTFKDEHLFFSAPRKWAKDPTITTVITEHPYAA